MPEHGQTTANRHFSESYTHRNNQYCYNRLNLENSIKISKTRIMK